jgi:hypothetical protein
VTQCIPKNTDKDPVNANPIKARDCGVFRMYDLVNRGSDIRKIKTARINSTRYTASGPNRTVGVR